VSILAAPKWTKRAWLAENGLSPEFAPLKFLKLAWQSEIASLKHEKFRSFRDRRPPSGHFLKAEGSITGFFELQPMGLLQIEQLHTVGEAVKQLSPERLEQYDEVPWRRIAGFRDILIHDYMGVDLDEVTDP
jgi:hypothetical protein